MNAGVPDRPDRFEQIARGMLVLALVAGIVWALAQGGALPLPGA
ncbi:hypothetical protein [Cognatiluteimonas weifangensis]|nr:hypothetical protein [Luteimonas weifangensis]